MALQTTTFLDLELPVLAAPMAGGPTTPALVRAAATAGSLGFLAAGYKTPEAFEAELLAVADVPFGVNLFAPHLVRVEPTEFAAYAAELHVGNPVLREDDDWWHEKVDLLGSHRPTVISFTFGLPPTDALSSLRGTGALLTQTVTSVDEARQAVAAGLDALVLQGSEAGGHSGRFDPRAPHAHLSTLLPAVLDAVDAPVLATGGLATPEAVRDVLHAGAAAALVGTALLLTDESGASTTYQAALEAGGRETEVTQAFSGRPARGLRNAFMEAHRDAPLGYPAIHHLTTPLRRAATAAGDPENVNLWAGTGYAHARREPAAVTLRRLTP